MCNTKCARKIPCIATIIAILLFIGSLCLEEGRVGTGLLALGLMISTAIYYHYKFSKNKKLWLGIGASLFITGMLEIATLHDFNEGWMTARRIILVFAATFIALFIGDAINKP